MDNRAKALAVLRLLNEDGEEALQKEMSRLPRVRGKSTGWGPAQVAEVVSKLREWAEKHD